MDEVCMQTNEALDEAVRMCFYLDRDLVSSKLLRLLDHHGVRMAKLLEIKLRPKTSRKQQKDMTLQLKRGILETDEFAWKNADDAGKAKEFNMDAKIDEELYYKRCMRKKVILYDEKDSQLKVIKLPKRNENVICIGVQNAAENIHPNKRKSLRNAKWIELTDSKLNRFISKQFPILNIALFTRSNPDAEVQGQTMLGKFTTHEYYCTNISYQDTDESSGAQKLQTAIFNFFKHYRSDEAQKKYEVLGNSEFQTEFKQLEKHVKECWSIMTCQYFNLSVRTNSV